MAFWFSQRPAPAGPAGRKVLILGLDGLGDVEGATLQEAGDALVARLLTIALALRSGGIGPVSSECGVDGRLLEFIWRLGEVAAAGGEPRELLFGSSP